MSVKLDIDFGNYKQMIGKLHDISETSDKVLEMTLKDFRTRGPAWITKETAEVYGVKKSALKRTAVKGRGFETEIYYKGGMHSVKSFGMKPGSPKKKGYSLTAEVLKGKRAQLSEVKKPTKKRRKGVRTSKQSPIMLMPVGGQYLPFQRVSERRNDLWVIKSLATPQMVLSKRVEPKLDKVITENVQQRLWHNLEYYLNKE